MDEAAARGQPTSCRPGVPWSGRVQNQAAEHLHEIAVLFNALRQAACAGSMPRDEPRRREHRAGHVLRSDRPARQQPPSHHRSRMRMSSQETWRMRAMFRAITETRPPSSRNLRQSPASIPEPPTTRTCLKRLTPPCARLRRGQSIRRPARAFRRAHRTRRPAPARWRLRGKAVRPARCDRRQARRGREPVDAWSAP